jgi:hypothetical protein
MLSVGIDVCKVPEAEAESVTGKSIENLHQALVQPNRHDYPKDGRRERP